jgi:pSer/pThr/pTyr-binding forkhead associated (FHA) protein
MSVVLEPAGKGLKIVVDKAIIFIGRHPDCDVVITRSRMISRKHCAIVQVNDAFMIRDLGSTNGIRINGQRIKKEGRFHVGDTLTIGDLDYAVKQEKTPEPEKRPNRDHPQDSRDAGAIRLPLASRVIPSPFSQEIPIAIPEEEEFDPQALTANTPDSMPVVADRKNGKPLDEADSVLESDLSYADDDPHIPLSD